MIRDSLILIAELAALFFGVAFLVHISQSWLGEERLRRWMGGPPVVAALKGIAVGFVTPFCSYSAIPMLLGLRRAGVAPAGYVAFIVAAPVLDPILFGALVLIVGWTAAVVYAAVAFSAAMGLALLAQRIDVERFLKPIESGVLVGSRGDRGQALAVLAPTEDSPDTSCSIDRADRRLGVRAEAEEASLYAFALMRTLGPILLLGVGIGLAIELLVPPEAVASVAGQDSVLAIPIAAGLGAPLYFNTELFIPIAHSLATVGVGVGAIVALTIAGAGANIPEFVILSKLVRSRVLIVFVGYVFVVAMVGGALAQALA